MARAQFMGNIFEASGTVFFLNIIENYFIILKNIFYVEGPRGRFQYPANRPKRHALSLW